LKKLKHKKNLFEDTTLPYLPLLLDSSQNFTALAVKCVVFSLYCSDCKGMINTILTYCRAESSLRIECPVTQHPTNPVSAADSMGNKIFATAQPVSQVDRARN